MKPAEDLDERLRAIRESPTYRLAYEDIELLGQEELRPLRLQLELLKPDRILHEQGIRSTQRFGSARVSDADGRARLGALERQARVTRGCRLRKSFLSHRRVEQARHYEQARRSALFRAFQQQNRRDFVRHRGGGIMEAANRGAFWSAHVRLASTSRCPTNRHPTLHVPKFAFRFHYSLRKMHLLHAKGASRWLWNAR